MRMPRNERCMRKYLYLYISIFVLMYTVPVQAESNRFFDTLHDVPVMSGLEPVPDMAINYDKPSGRISEAGAIIPDNLTDRAVLSFYTASLSQMGWRSLGRSMYQRNAEKLTISIEKTKASRVIRFSIFPR